MGIKLHLDHWPFRLMGVLFGVGCLAVGLSGIIGADLARADFAIIASITGLIATAGSLLTTDIIGF